MAVDIVKKLYDTDHFTALHLGEAFSLVNTKRLLTRGPYGRKPHDRKQRKEQERWQREPARKVVLDLGYSLAAIADVEEVLDFEPDRIVSIFHNEDHFAGGVREMDLERQIMSLNLLQYYLEKDLPSLGSDGHHHFDEEAEDPETEVEN